MSGITTHVLDTGSGSPGFNIHTRLEFQVSPGAPFQEKWEIIAQGRTNDDGRIPGFLKDDHQLKQGIYRITFDTHEYFQTQGKDCFYPYASVVFEIKDPDSHYHVPLLISGFGFSTYRGS